MSDDKNKVTFVLTGPREGYTGVLGGRYGFNDGKLTVDHSFRDGLRNILCVRYCCNIQNEAPLWKTVTENGLKASVKVTELDIKPVGEPVATMEPPKASVKVEVSKPVEKPKLETDKPPTKEESKD